MPRLYRSWTAGLFVCFVVTLVPVEGLQAFRVLELEEKRDIYPMGLHLDILEDPSRKLSLKEVRSDALQERWVANQEPAPNYGASQSAYWVRYRIKSNLKHFEEFYLTIANPYLDHVRVYVFKNDTLLRTIKTGDVYPYRTRDVPHRNFVFKHSLQPADVLTVYMRIEIVGMMDLPVTLHQADAFILHNRIDYIWYAFYFGILLSMIVYNLFVYLSIREAAYIYYILFLLGLFFMNMSSTGLAPEFLWPGATQWTDRSTNLLLGLVIILASLFFNSYLNLKEHLPVFRRILIGLLVLVFGLTLLAQFIKYPTIKLLYMSIAPVSLLLLIVGVIAWRKGVPGSQYYLMAWGGLILGVAIHVSKRLGYLDANFITENSAFMGSIAEVLLFSFGLADKINQERRSRLKAQYDLIESQQKNIQVERKLKFELERLVEERTVELHQALKTKDKFMSIIAHDLRGPVGTISFLLKDIIEKDDGLDLDLLKEMQKSTENVHQLLENLLVWAQSQKDEIECKPANFLVGDALKASINLLQSTARTKKINVNLSGELSLYAFADEAMVQTVVRNLLNNALKFSTENSSIELIVRQVGAQVEVAVQDNGVGMPPETVASIFSLEKRPTSSPGTNNEKGTGLGLVLCKEFVEANGGAIQLDSTPGKGTRICFSLPMGEADIVSKASLEDLLVQIQNLRVLIVEDNELNLRTILLAIKDLGLCYLIARDGEVAHRLLMSSHFDIVLMDIDLPLMSGMEVSRRSRHKSPDQIILAVTSHSKQDLQADLERGILDGHLAKPFERDRFLETLQPLGHRIEALVASNQEHAERVGLQNILLIDDSKEFKVYVEHCLKPYGINLVTASNGAEGLQECQQEQFDLILLDINLVNEDGFDILARLQAYWQEYGKSVPVIATTASDSTQIIEKISASEFSGYIRKPFTRKSLNHLLAAHVEPGD